MVRLPRTGLPTGLSRRVKPLPPRVSSHAAHEGVPRLGCAPGGNVPDMIPQDGDRPSRAPAWPLAPLAPRRPLPPGLPQDACWCSLPPGPHLRHWGSTLISGILPSAPKLNGHWLSTRMNVKVGGSHTQQVGCLCLLHPLPRFSRTCRRVGSDGIFAGGRPGLCPAQSSK